MSLLDGRGGHLDICKVRGDIETVASNLAKCGMDVHYFLPFSEDRIMPKICFANWVLSHFVVLLR